MPLGAPLRDSGATPNPSHHGVWGPVEGGVAEKVGRGQEEPSREDPVPIPEMELVQHFSGSAIPAGTLVHSMCS